MAAKKKKKASKKIAPSRPTAIWRDMILYGAILVAGLVASFFFKGDLPWFSPSIYAWALVTGLLTGISGNPVFVLLPASLLVTLGLDGPGGTFVAGSPMLQLGVFFPKVFIVFSVAAVMSLSTIHDGIRKNWLRYEPVLLIPALGLLGMTAAWWARRTAPLFNDPMIGLANGTLFLGLVFLMFGVLTVVMWSTGERTKRRHWLWSVAAGPVIGFWAGYVTEVWVLFIVALVFSVYLLVLGEDVMGILCGAPLMIAPLAGAKFMYVYHGFSGIVNEGAPGLSWGLFLLYVVIIGTTHLWAVRLMSRVGPKMRNALFFGTLVLFAVFALIELVT